MGDEYQFICLECELKITLGREKGGSSNSNPLRFYYYDFNSKNSRNKSTLSANYSIGITNNSPEVKNLEVKNHNGEIIVNCPSCFSNHTLIYKLDDWIENYQVW